jgi:two-component system sensor histidine kinase/response regulator
VDRLGKRVAVMKVLIAEDEPVFRRMLEHTLNSWGYDVVVTADGLEAWRSLTG